MSLTTPVKDELARLTGDTAEQRRAEVAAILRFAGGLHLVSGRRIVVEAELDHTPSVNRLVASLKELYGADAEVISVESGSLHRGPRYQVRVTERGRELARLVGMVDGKGYPVLGMPVAVIRGGRRCAGAAWRGAFLARGSLTEPGRSSALEITCPSSEAALALVGAARRFEVIAKSKEVRGMDRVVVRDGEAIGVLLEKMGAVAVNEAWGQRRERREVRGTANRLANFDDANLRRSARAAVASGARVERAFEILGDDVPAHLVQAGRLRIEHKEASLEELGQLSEPQLTKDAVAGRIRRLLAMADKRAQELGVPDTESVLTQDMLDM
ncbi:DNA-binding protein WhiA [Actinomyces trachealis]|uniref:DNA-binding protein WhiA n=1 Tax=Actinomyces trachealis TaxID=2763540 RepID=UPI0018929C8C|nr:DNA-binding protein WhiA [Actinomyces trachealis]